jgi:hypothetical protein
LRKIARLKAELERGTLEKTERERAEAEAEFAERREQEQQPGKKMRRRDSSLPTSCRLKLKAACPASGTISSNSVASHMQPVHHRLTSPKRAWILPPARMIE